MGGEILYSLAHKQCPSKPRPLLWFGLYFFVKNPVTRRDNIIDKIMGRCEVRPLHSHDSLGIAKFLFETEALDFAASFAKNDSTFLVGLDLVIKSPIRNNFSTLGM